MGKGLSAEESEGVHTFPHGFCGLDRAVLCCACCDVDAQRWLFCGSGVSTATIERHRRIS